jgi:hypothetical protein
MDAPPLFYDDHFQALRAAIENGRGYKETAMHLWPSMRAESAYARLKSACRDSGDHKLDLAETVQLCKFNGSADPLYYLADELSHERPRPKAAEDAARTLLEQLTSVAGNFNEGVARLDRLLKANPALLRAVKTSGE